MSDIKSLAAHVALYWLGVAKHNGGLWMNSEVGPYVEGLADVFDRVSVLAYEVPDRTASLEDVADYRLTVPRDNVDLVSLGPKGTWRDYPARSKRVRSIVRAASGAWDVLLLRFDRRSHPVFAANRCRRTITMVHAQIGAGAGVESASVIERLAALPKSLRVKWDVRRTIRRSSLFVTDGEDCLAEYARYASDAELIRLSLRRARWAHDASDRLVGTTPRFLFVGQLNRKKGIIETIDAFAEIKNRLVPDAMLDVVGTGPDLEGARERARELGIEEGVIFHGWVKAGEELFARYRRADVLLFLSRSTTESFPRVVTEAMAHSVLVVGTPVGSLPRTFKADTEIMFVSPDPDSVVAAVRRLLSDSELRRAMIERGQQWAKETSLEEVMRLLAVAVERRWPELAAKSQ